MDTLLRSLGDRYAGLRFDTAAAFSWRPDEQLIVYPVDARTEIDRWSLLHEVGHALLDHRRFTLDFELVEMEMAAWEEATRLGREFGLHIADDHIQDCLDTYRSWQYHRSICPTCETVGLQEDSGHAYACFNCGGSWQVSPSRFCRHYRSARSSYIK